MARGKFQWTVFHRFSEFDEIRKNLAKTYPNVMSWPNFPGKKLINKTVRVGDGCYSGWSMK